MTPIRSADELFDVDVPAWPRLRALLSKAPFETRVLPADDTARRNVLYRLQVTAASTLGAIASNCGTLVLDHGWVRILGAGSEGIQDLATVNALSDPDDRAAPPGHLVVGYDGQTPRF